MVITDGSKMWGHEIVLAESQENVSFPDTTVADDE